MSLAVTKEAEQMSGAANRLARRREAKLILDQLFKEQSTVNVVHYSCESFREKSLGESPRITSIAIHNLASRQTRSFSIHQIAERKRSTSNPEEIDQNYDELELAMLQNFYQFVRNNINSAKWLHWNMNDSTFGFQAISHRYEVLGGYPVDIPDSQLFDISALLIDIYGPAYIGHRRLTNIMKKNEITDRFFLEGEAEAEAFKRREYVRLHRSTLRKVEVIHAVAERAWAGTLRTNARWWQQYGLTVEGLVEAAKEHWIYTLLSIVCIGLAIAGFIIPLLRY